jgi:hypothetical protein
VLPQGAVGRLVRDVGDTAPLRVGVLAIEPAAQLDPLHTVRLEPELVAAGHDEILGHEKGGGSHSRLGHPQEPVVELRHALEEQRPSALRLAKTKPR